MACHVTLYSCECLLPGQEKCVAWPVTDTIMSTGLGVTVTISLTPFFTPLYSQAESSICFYEVHYLLSHLCT